MINNKICIYPFLFCTLALQALQQNISKLKIDLKLPKALVVVKCAEKLAESKQNEQQKKEVKKSACHLEGLAGGEPSTTCLLRDFFKTLVLYDPKIPKKFSMLGSHGYIFFGPPGTGKSKSVRLIAEASGAHLLMYNLAMVVKQLAANPRAIDEIYKQAKDMLDKEGRPVMVVFDDVRNEDNQKDVLLILNSYIDEYFNNPYIITIFTLNHDIKQLDKGLLNRCEAVEWELPNDENRLAIIGFYAKEFRSSEVPQFLDKLVELSKGWSGREIEDSFHRARIIMVQNKSEFLEQSYVLQAFTEEQESMNKKSPIIVEEKPIIVEEKSPSYFRTFLSICLRILLPWPWPRP